MLRALKNGLSLSNPRHTPRKDGQSPCTERAAVQESRSYESETARKPIRVIGTKIFAWLRDRDGISHFPPLGPLGLGGDEGKGLINERPSWRTSCIGARGEELLLVSPEGVLFPESRAGAVASPAGGAEPGGGTMGGASTPWIGGPPASAPPASKERTRRRFWRISR